MALMLLLSGNPAIDIDKPLDIEIMRGRCVNVVEFNNKDCNVVVTSNGCEWYLEDCDLSMNQEYYIVVDRKQTPNYDDDEIVYIEKVVTNECLQSNKK